LNRLNQRQRLDPMFFVVAYVGMGNKQEALSWLEKAYSERSPSMISLKVNPTFDPLRSEPRFQALLRHMALAS
jgi:hypothetical protein